MGDFNAKIGANTRHRACGMFGLGETNERCDLLLDWLDDNKLFAVNTSFQHRIGQRRTWCSPDGIIKNQIDFITLRRSDRKECKYARILKSADCGTDHHLVWAKIEGCAWSNTLRKRKPHKLQLANLRTKEVAASFEAELKIKMSSKQLNWPDFSQALVATASEQCPKEQQPNKPWIDSKCWEMIEEREKICKERTFSRRKISGTV